MRRACRGVRLRAHFLACLLAPPLAGLEALAAAAFMSGSPPELSALVGLAHQVDPMAKRRAEAEAWLSGTVAPLRAWAEGH